MKGFDVHYLFFIATVLLLIFGFYEYANGSSAKLQPQNPAVEQLSCGTNKVIDTVLRKGTKANGGECGGDTAQQAESCAKNLCILSLEFHTEGPGGVGPHDAKGNPTYSCSDAEDQCHSNQGFGGCSGYWNGNAAESSSKIDFKCTNKPRDGGGFIYDCSCTVSKDISLTLKWGCTECKETGGVIA